MERAFKGVWIPADIWMDKELTWPEKLYMAEIDSLDNGKGCFASTQYLGNFFQHTRQRAHQVISSLKEKSRLLIWEEEYKGKPRRHMRVIDERMKHITKEELSNIFDKGVKYICTYNKEDNKENTNIEQSEADMKKSIRSRFFKLYSLKAKEKTGSDRRGDGKLIAPPWTGKEGALFKADYESYGPIELKRLMHVFFADQVHEAKEFSKKAGYTYPVFHSQIPKLQMSSKKEVLPCESCGSWGLHYNDCETEKKETEKWKIADEDEIIKAREQFKGVDIMAEVMKKRKERNDGS